MTLNIVIGIVIALALGYLVLERRGSVSSSAAALEPPGCGGLASPAAG